MKFLSTLALAAICFLAQAQPAHYTVANAHAHNDYVHPQPFATAYGQGFGSIEVDIFLVDDSLLVGHQFSDTKLKRTIQNLYLTPLQQKITANNGYPYADTSRNLQLLIDIKTDSTPTINKLVDVLRTYPALINNPKIHFTITGNRPDESLFTSYPSFVWFDGELNKTYSPAALTKIVMLSDDFENYSKWNGSGVIPSADKQVLLAGIAKSHQLHKPVRFWDAPDFDNAWKEFILDGVDYLNTDRLKELAAFFKQQP
jgi:alkaline phosphatase